MTENSVRYMQPPELRQVFTKKKLLSGTLTGQEKLNDTTVRQDCGDNMADSDSGGDLNQTLHLSLRLAFTVCCPAHLHGD